MSRSLLVVVHRDKQLLADAAAARLVTAIVDAQASRGEADIVLTGGSMGSAVLSSLAASPVHDAIDWSRVNVCPPATPSATRRRRARRCWTTWR
jgi:6-phosphogluconolactonase